MSLQSGSFKIGDRKYKIASSNVPPECNFYYVQSVPSVIILMTKHFTFIFTCFILSSTLFAQKIEEGYDVNFKPAPSGWRYYVVTEKKK